MHSIFLDHCTTTPIAASVRESMLPFLQNLYGHPACTHWMGRAAAEAIEDARSHLASLLECHPNEIIFTSGGTESINLGLLGVSRAIGHSVSSPHCIISNLEHAAVKATAAQLQREGWQVTTIACNHHGQIEPDHLEQALHGRTRLISITHACHRLGTIQPIAEIAQLCLDRDILLHSDAAQTVGKIDCNVQRLGVDLLSLSGHKFYAPKGIGALYLRLGVPIEPILYGESGEAGLRPGTPSVAHIVALGQAARLAQAGLNSAAERVGQLRDQFHSRLESLIGKPIPIHGRAAERLPGVLCIELPGVSAEQLQSRLPEICFGPSDSANGRTLRPKDDVYAGLNLSPAQVASTLRISLGWTTSEEELQRAAQLIAMAYESLAGMSSA